MNAITTWLAASALALLLAASPLLEGPSELDAAQDTAADVQDAQHAARASQVATLQGQP